MGTVAGQLVRQRDMGFPYEQAYAYNLPALCFHSSLVLEHWALPGYRG